MSGCQIQMKGKTADSDQTYRLCLFPRIFWHHTVDGKWRYKTASSSADIKHKAKQPGWEAFAEKELGWTGLSIVMYGMLPQDATVKNALTLQSLYDTNLN